MSVVVVDASTAVKWFFPEAGHDAARELLLGKQRRMAPSLIQVEVAAAIVRKARLGEIRTGEAQAAADLWLQAIADGVVTLAPDEQDLPGAVKLALALQHPLQDCLYLGLAERLGAPMVTADGKFRDKASGSHPNLRLLDRS